MARWLSGTLGRWCGREFGKIQAEPEGLFLKNIFSFACHPSSPSLTFPSIKDSFELMSFSFKTKIHPSENKTPSFHAAFYMKYSIKLAKLTKIQKPWIFIIMRRTGGIYL